MQEYQTILKSLTEIIKPFIPKGHAVSENTDLVADLGLDSLKVMKILESVEDQFDVAIP